jgi:hypothetical protein
VTPTNDPTALAFSPDGRYLVAGMSGLGFAPTGSSVVWDVETGTEVARFDSGEGAVRAHVFAGDGSSVWSLGDDGIHQWDLIASHALARTGDGDPVMFRAGDVVLSSRLIEGQFPSWRQLIPESFEHEVRLPREEFLEIARRISQLAQRNAPLRLAFAEGEVTVAAETPDIGDASEAMPAPYSGEPLEIAFNPQFLVEGIESVASEELAVQLSSPLRPGLLRPVDGEDFSYLVMPIRLNP